MGKPTGFKEITRQIHDNIPVHERVKNYDEFIIPLSEKEISAQGARCMDCGVPFCHSGCPVNNIIPDWNDLVYQRRFPEALSILHSTNNFPEFTGRICPAPCESSCTLNIEDNPVAIKDIELAIVERGFKEGLIHPEINPIKTGKKIAIIGSGPAGLAASQQLVRAGHSVTLYEKNNKIGGLLRYGIPDFKLSKSTIDRRLSQLESEGVIFMTGIHVGYSMLSKDLLSDYDAVLLTCGSERPRDLPLEGRSLQGIHFAMEFLGQSNRKVSGEGYNNKLISAQGKHVVVIGGGDTGSDCVGTSNRQGASSITQLEIMPKPPSHENKALSWPHWPMKLRTSSSHEEGCDRHWSVTVTGFRGYEGKVTGLNLVKVGTDLKPITGSEFSLDCDLVLLAMGFVHPIKEGLLNEIGVILDGRQNVQANTIDYKTSVPKIFAAGDVRRGQSLVVWAIREGRQAAKAIDEFLMGKSDLPS